MLMYGWMMFVEHAPQRYDWAVKLMTAGRIDRIKDMIAERISPDEKVLDIGCGTGSLGRRCLDRGAEFYGLDCADYMLAQAKRTLDASPHAARGHVIRDSVSQVGKHFETESLDAIVSSMALGEFPREYLNSILQECKRILKPGGKLLIADEVAPEGTVAKILYGAVMALLWIPQFVLLRRAFFPVRDLKGIIAAAGFSVEETHAWPGSTFQLVCAAKR